MDKQRFTADFEKLIACESVLSAPKENMPFGEGVYKAYSFFMELAKEFGFETINYDNYIGEIVFGEGEELGIIGHLDVVPVGDGWNTNPFELTLKDGVYYGRGVSDDKGAMLLTLYIIKELKDSGVKVNRKFRFFVGCDEESGWRDIGYFKTKGSFPEYGFSPDGNFPVSFAEKGINVITFDFPKFNNFYGIKGGTVFNAVCGYAEVYSKIDIDNDLLKKYGLTAEGNKIISIGKSCHGSRPEQGKNAIKPLFEYMRDMGEDLTNAVDYLFNDKAGFNKIITEQGSVTFSPDVIEETDNGVNLYCDMRIPYPYKLEDLSRTFDTFGIKCRPKKIRDPLFVDKNSDLVHTLINSYNKITGENAKPIYQCGGTFAYVFDKGVAFGPEYPDVPSTIHQANESLSEKALDGMYAIYKDAIFTLAKGNK